MVDELYSVYILAICCQSIISCNGELNENSVVRFYRTTAVDGKQYDVAHYNLDMVLVLGYRGDEVHSGKNSMAGFWRLMHDSRRVKRIFVAEIREKRILKSGSSTKTKYLI